MNEESCKAAAAKMQGYSFKSASGKYVTKGCYCYDRGSYRGTCWFGKGGSREKMLKTSPSSPKFRVKHDECL